MSSTTPMIMRQGRTVPWLYVGPALIIMLIFVVYPTLRTTYLSFRNDSDSGWASSDCSNAEDAPCAGVFENYRRAFTSDSGQIALRNTALWLIIMVPGTVVLGLLLAVLTDRVAYGSVAKSIIFLPMAISFVGASIIWRFVYDPNANIGLLNAILKLFGGDAKAWLATSPPGNTFLLIVVGIWVWTGFTMTILAAALRSIPEEILEAARVDGANELQVFFRIMLPHLLPTIAVVLTTMTINTLKIFDIVWVLKGIDTDVIATRMVSELYLYNNDGLAAAYAVILILLIVPVMILNVRRFNAEEAAR
ncbi:carbohydrate ABC transporter permease [Aggregatilinea lenta]|uniref:carbohydrate ABC transporter permease n=1 Tax=Aggregatilinea lenta TaxID=913108 RepID=UPI001EE8EE27|nr:sugar ABC transporter permease [Aggregatilinea lenta]